MSKMKLLSIYALIVKRNRLLIRAKKCNTLKVRIVLTMFVIDLSRFHALV